MKIFHLPDLGEGLAEAEIREWYINEGDVVKVDQPLVSMETAKAVVDVPSPYAGKIVKLHGGANEIVKTGAPLITYEMENAAAAKPTGDKGTVVGKLETSESKWDDGDVIVGAPKTTTQTVRAMPAARVLATELGVDLNSVTGSGPQGLITVQDVKAKLGQGQRQENRNHFASDDVDAEKLHGVRRSMALAMVQSHQEVVPVTIFDEVDISHLPEKTDLTVRLLQAIAAAAAAEPAMNAWFDGKNLSRKLSKAVNVGLAVDTPEGLFVPVIKNVEQQAAESLRATIDTYKRDVKNRSVSPKDLQGATITLSNFGMISGRYATPIIVPPAVAILGCGKSRLEPMVKDGKVVVGKRLPLSLTFDHRAATGGEATRFLGALIKALES